MKKRVLMAAGLCGVSLLIGGCEMPAFLNTLRGEPPVDKIALPPEIPVPPPEVSVEDPGSPYQRLVYTDIIELEQALLNNHQPLETEKDRTHHAQSLALIHAVQDSIKKGVLKPQPYDKDHPAYFEIKTPVRYGDFYQWAMGFEHPAPAVSDAAAGASNDNGGWMAGLQDDKSQPAEPASAATSQSSEYGLTLPLDKDGLSLGEDTPITRETLCMLYTVMSRQEGKAAELGEADILKANPLGGNSVYALGEFADLKDLSPWAPPYVALAYRDGILKSALGLRPAMLVNQSGFHPKAPVTRGEALIFLYQFYASR